MIAIGVGLALSLAMTSASATPPRQDVAAARRLFIEIESATRLPSSQQRRRLERVYRDVCPALTTMFIAHTVFGPPATVPASASPREAADLLEREGGSAMLGEAGRRRCQAFLTTHRTAVETLIRDDLRNGTPRDQRWALRVVEEIRAVRLFDDVVAALGSRDLDPIYVAQALRGLDDPRGIPPLIRHVPDDPTRFYDIVRSLQRKRPPHPLLLELLRSPVAKVRSQAAYALVESADPALVPFIPSLVGDVSPDVRRQAGHIVTNFAPGTYRLARPSLAPLLADPDVTVRSDIAIALGHMKDPASASVLFGLLEIEDKLEPWRQSNIAQAIQTLTGSYFGLTPGTISSPEIRAKALAAFAVWIKSQTPETR